jgi:bacillithiol system protein YtxJ
MPNRLRTEAEVEAAFSAPRYLLFKHSPTCPISAGAFREYERFAAEHPDVPTGWIQVVAERALARAVAERTGVRHESPQAILLAAGSAEWDASHGAITVESLAEATARPSR